MKEGINAMPAQKNVSSSKAIYHTPSVTLNIVRAYYCNEKRLV